MMHLATKEEITTEAEVAVAEEVTTISQEELIILDSKIEIISAPAEEDTESIMKRLVLINKIIKNMPRKKLMLKEVAEVGTVVAIEVITIVEAEVATMKIVTKAMVKEVSTETGILSQCYTYRPYEDRDVDYQTEEPKSMEDGGFEVVTDRANKPTPYAESRGPRTARGALRGGARGGRGDYSNNGYSDNRGRGSYRGNYRGNYEGRGGQRHNYEDRNEEPREQRKVSFADTKNAE